MSITLTYAFTVVAKSASDDIAIVWVGAASCWRETVRGTWDKNKLLESKQEIKAEPTMSAADVCRVS